MRIGGFASFAAFFLSVVLLSSPALANCGLARSVAQIETASRAVIAAPTIGAATIGAAQLENMLRAARSSGAVEAGAARYLAAKGEALRLLRAGEIAGAKSLLASDGPLRSVAAAIAKNGGADCLDQSATPPNLANAVKRAALPTVATRSAASQSSVANRQSGGGELRLADRISRGGSIDWDNAFGGTAALAPIVAVLALVTFCGAIYSLFQDKRQEKRYLCYVPVEVSGNSQRAETAMLDVNRTGARVVIENLKVKPGDSVAISIGGKLRRAVVIWSKKGRAGIKFERALGGRDLRSIQSIARAGAGFERVTNKAA